MSDKVNTQSLVSGAPSNAPETIDFINKKSERLASAVYLVTAYLSDSDPIKWKLRQLSLEVMSFILSTVQKEVQESTPSGLVDLSDVSLRVKEVLSLIGIVLSSGTVSQMNFTLIQGEYLKLLNLLQSLNNSLSGQSFLLVAESSQLLNQPKTELSATSPESSREVRSMVGSDADSGVQPKPPKDNTKGHKMSKDTVLENSVSNLPARSKRQLTKNERKSKIILFLRDKDWVSIKDISDLVSEVSAKTIQRELNALVDANVLNKKGERRWSRYRLSGR